MMSRSMQANGLEAAAQKTEAALYHGQKQCRLLYSFSLGWRSWS